MDDNRPFPIQHEYGRNEQGDMERHGECTVPWWLAEIAYKQYAKLFGTRQSLERLAERGGFGREEFVRLLRQDDFK